MPRPGPRRPLVAVRLSEQGIAEVDRLAQAQGVNRSEMIRRLLAEALAVRAARALRR
jgi:metal-responsive CopG/Arc/MetJ family transcriptional regulator